MSELLPCPFCGNEPRVDDFSTDYRPNAGPSWRVMCKGPCSMDEVWTDSFDTEAEAIAAWNHRSQPTSPDAEMVERLTDAIEPLANLAGGGMNMNDPLSKWFTVGQFIEAKEAQAAALASPPAGLQDTMREALVEALNAIHAARIRKGLDHGYGWNITALNKAMNAALPLLGKSVPEPLDLSDEEIAALHALAQPQVPASGCPTCGATSASNELAVPASVGEAGELIARLEHALDEANRTGEAATLRPVDLAAAISALCCTAARLDQNDVREALKLYGVHLGSCEVEQAKTEEDLLSARCTCGLRAALSQEQG